MINNNVLLLDAQSVQTLIVAESLFKSGYKVFLFCDGKNNYGYHTKYAFKKVVAPLISNETQYLNFLVSYIKEEKINVLIPLADESACFVSKHKSELKDICNFIMPDWDVFQKAYDKNLLMTLCAERGYPHPKSLDLSKINFNDICAVSIKFPALIKPNYTMGGRGMTLVTSVNDFKEKYPLIHKEYGECHLQEFIKPGGKQIKVQIFITEQGWCISSVIHKQRYYPEKGGSSCCNVTIAAPELVEVCKSVLKDIGWYGFADFDLIEDPCTHEFKIMEINPRIPACIKSAIKSGVDYPIIIVDASLGKQLKSYEYNPGKKLRHIGFEILWFLYSKNRFHTNPNWFSFFSKGLSYQDFSWRDPIPFFFGTIGNIKKQLNPEFRKKKSGLR